MLDHRANLSTLAVSLVDQLESVFDDAVRRVAATCSRNGKLAADLLDAHQWSSYELSLAKADLLAARTLVQAGGNISELDAGLGFAFVSEALVSTIARLDAICLATDLDTGPLQRIASGEELRSLRRAVAGPETLSALGGAVAEMSGELADVLVDEQTALARDSFRRFADAFEKRAAKVSGRPLRASARSLA